MLLAQQLVHHRGRALLALSQCSCWAAGTPAFSGLLSSEQQMQEERRSSGLHAGTSPSYTPITAIAQSLRHASFSVSPASGPSESTAASQVSLGLAEGALQEEEAKASSSEQQEEIALSPLQQQQQLMSRALIQPLPVGRVINGSIHDAVVELNGNYFLDPAKTLESTMRVLQVVKQVLANDGFVGVINCNPAFQPLMQEAAFHCSNANVFWHWQDWEKGMLSGKLTVGSKQPFRGMLRSRGMTMVNVHCPKADPISKPQPKLASLHKWRLLARRPQGSSEKTPQTLLQEILAAETQAARLPLAGSLTEGPGRLQLLIVLDLSYGAEAIEEAFTHGLLTASVVNAHTPLDRITYPIYAGENHPAYQHFFLDWFLKAVNVLTHEEEAAFAAKRAFSSDERRPRAARQQQSSQHNNALGARDWHTQMDGHTRMGAGSQHQQGRQSLFSNQQPRGPAPQRRER